MKHYYIFYIHLLSKVFKNSTNYSVNIFPISFHLEELHTLQNLYTCLSEQNTFDGE